MILSADEIMMKQFRVARRPVEPRDAEFILSLRTDPALGRFLSPTDPDPEKQRAWIRNYKDRELRGEEYYFVFEDAEGYAFGVDRVYNIAADRFEAGSWLFRPGSPEGLAVLADISTRDFGFSLPGMEYCVFSVMKGNKAVLNYHKWFRAEQTAEDEHNLFFRLSRQRYVEYRDKILASYL